MDSNQKISDIPNVHIANADPADFIRLQNLDTAPFECRMSFGLLEAFKQYETTIAESLRLFQKATQIFGKYPDCWLVIANPERKRATAPDSDDIAEMPGPFGFYASRGRDYGSRHDVTFLLSHEY